MGIFKVDQKVLGLVIGDAGLSGHGSLRGHLKAQPWRRSGVSWRAANGCSRKAGKESFYCDSVSVCNSEGF